LAAASLAAGQYRRADVGDVEIGEPKSGPDGESVIEARPARANAIR
jgi:hypothetical protein